MSRADTALEAHLRALFANLDTAEGFDARLMARLRAETDVDATARAVRARQQERARHHRAVAELQSGGRSMLRLLTLDTLGIALLLVLFAVGVWPHIAQNVLEVWRRYGVYVSALLGVVIAAVPLAGMWAEQMRRPVRLL